MDREQARLELEMEMVRRRYRIEKWKEEKRKELDTSAGKDENWQHE